MHYLIYKITNRLDNKFYVGKHKTENKDDGYFGSGILIERAVTKHGKENFVKEILFDLPTEEEMNQTEADIVDEDFVAREDTYNLMVGGYGGFSFVNKSGKNLYENHASVSRENLKKATVGFKKKWSEDEEFREAMKSKISASVKRRREIYGSPFQGKHHTDETRRHLSQLRKGKYTGKNNSVYGKHWYTNGLVNKMIDTSEIPVGWYRGRV